MKFAGVVCLLLALADSSVGQANQAKSRGARIIEDLLSRTGVFAVPPPVLENQYSLIVPIRWNAYVTDRPFIRPETAPATPEGGFAISQSQIRQLPEPAVIPRAPELSTNQLLVAAVDSQQQLRGWTLL